MKSRQIWIIAGTAIVSFALGLIVAPSLRKPAAGSVAAIRQTKSNGRSASAIGSGDAEEFPGRTRTGATDEKKKPSEPRISIPITTVPKIIREQQASSRFNFLGSGMEKVLPLLGASELEANDIKTLLKRVESEILTEEKKHLNVIQADETQIRLDNSTMKDFSAGIVQRTQDGIRSILPADLAEVLISSFTWDQFYPTDELYFPTLNITRSRAGQMTARASDIGVGFGYPVDPKFTDDGTPIPADQVFPDRWKPFLKGLTLLPQNEK